MKRIILYSFALVLLTATGCESFKEAKGIKKMEPLTVNVIAKSLVPEVASTVGLTLSFSNPTEFNEPIIYQITSEEMVIEGLIPGFYTITVSGQLLGDDGLVYKMSDSKIDYALVKDHEELDFNLKGDKASPLLFKEIFYANCKNKSGGNYLFAQFYEIYNNSDFTVYLDGLHFADLEWTTATSGSAANVYTPAMDLTNNVYAIRLWKVPGDGTQYPLKPGESFIMVQRAMNHTDANPEVDYTTAEFEFFMPKYGIDYDAPNMDHVCYQGSISVGNLNQYLTAVSGPAMIIFRVPTGEIFDPLNDAVRRGTSGNNYAPRISITWVLDAVENGPNATSVAYKRIKSVIDTGMSYVGDNYNNISVVRRVSEETGPNGELRLVDDNNSSTDFVPSSSFDNAADKLPKLRRYGVGMPSWNHSLQP